MKKLLVLLTLCLFSGISVWAEKAGTYTVEGVLQDSISKQSVGFATVRLMSDGKQLPDASALTDEAGKFSLTTKKAGTYKLVCSLIGKKTVTQTVKVSGSTALNVGNVLMSNNETALKAVKVTAQKPMVKADVDKMTYSIADDPDAQTNTMLEMLRKVPMVTVDGEDNIKVNGSSSFKIYVNGKPNQMMSSNPSEILKNYPASAVKKIEVITNPGAKYDAEGVAGVLNIITTQDTEMKGYTVTPRLRVDNHGVMGSFFGMAKFGKFTLSAHYGIGYHSDPVSKTWSEREVYAEATNHLLRTDGASKGHGLFQFGSLDGSYEFDEKNLLSFSAGIHGYGGKENSDNGAVMRNTADEQVYSYHQHSYTKASRYGINAAVDYQHTFKPDETLTFSYQLDMHPSQNKTTNTYSNLQNLPFTLTDLYSNPDMRSFEHTGQMDFVLPLNKQNKISTGLKYIYRLNKSNNVEEQRTPGTDEDFAIDADRSLRYRHRGDIAAAYGEYNYTSKAFSAMGGVRYEYYHMKVTYPDGKRDAFKTHMGDWVPSIRFGYNLSQTQMLKLGYNMRIERPGIEELSPYVTHNTPEADSYGNPNMKSAKAHNIEGGYSLFGSKLSINSTLTYSFSNNGLVNYSFLSNGVEHSTYDNILHNKDLTLSLYTNWLMTKTTSFNVNADGGYMDMKVKNTSNHNSGFYASCWTGITQKLPSKFKVVLWMGGSTRDVQLQGKGSYFYMYNFNLSRTFLKDDRLELSLRAGNFIGRYHYFRNEKFTSDYSYISSNRVDFLRLGFGISYRLGNLKAQVKKAARTIENTDVNKSSGNNQGEGGEN